MTAVRRALSSLHLQLLCTALCALILNPRIAHAQTVRVDLDPAQTRILFTLGATLHRITGTFDLKSGFIQFDLSTGKVSDGAIVVDATSEDSGNSGRDSKMQKIVLESAKYPEIVFLPQQIHGQVAIEGESQVQIEGVMRVHGAEHAITVPVTTRIGDGKVSAKAELTIPYVEWGLKDPGSFIRRVEKGVKINTEAEGQVEVAH